MNICLCRAALLGAALACIASLPVHGAELTADQAGERIAILRAEIAHHDDLYFQKAAPEISDFAYDQLKRELRELEQAHPDAAARAPVFAGGGDDRSGDFPTARHRVRMLSLDKAHDEAGLRSFLERTTAATGRGDATWLIEPKYDGLAVSITYAHGRLVRAVTRGDGSEGDDITANVLTIRSLVRELRTSTPDGAPVPIPDLVELRGELFLSFAEFERLNREREAAGEAPFATPRNAAAGSAKLLDPREAAARNLEIVFHGWGAWEPAESEVPTQQAFHERIRAWGLPAVTNLRGGRNADEVWAAVQEFAHDREAWPFPNDGAVIKLDDVHLRHQLGETPQAPRWSIAYKFAPDRAETRLLAITLQVGRTGLLTPVAEFEPITLAGTVVTRATLHNRDAIARLDVRIGDFVYVEKAGEIIPAIVGVNRERRPADARPFVFPAACPACGTSTVQRDGESAVRCPNVACPAQLRRRLEHFASRDGVVIEGLGPATIDALVSRGRLRDIADLYRLQREDLLALGNNVEVSAEQLLAAIEQSRHAELWRFIHGLNIPRVGSFTARDLARTFGSLDKLAAAAEADLVAAGVGVATARSVREHFARPENRAIVTALRELGIKPSAPPTNEGRRTLAGKVFVLTGRLPTLTRERATELIEAAGGTVRSAVSGNTDYVLAGAEPGTKLDRARELGIAVIDEAELRRMLGVE